MTNGLRLLGISSQLGSKEILRDAENLRHNNNWDMVHCMHRGNSAALQHSRCLCRIVECSTRKHFPTQWQAPIMSRIPRYRGWQRDNGGLRHKMSLDAAQYFLRVMCPVFPCQPTMPQFGSITGSHSANIWRHCAGAMVSLQSWYLPHVSSRGHTAAI